MHRVVLRLVGESTAPWLPDEQLDELFATHRGNLREVLFALYDLYEQHFRYLPAQEEPLTERGKKP